MNQPIFKVIKDLGEARVGDTCERSGSLKDETQFHSGKLFDSIPVYGAGGELVTYMSRSRRISYWVEWLKNDKLDTYLIEQ